MTRTATAAVLPQGAGEPSATVPLSDLLAALKRNVWALPTRTPVPVMAGIMLRIGADRLVLESFDYEVGCTSRLDAATSGEGVRLVPGRALQDMLKPLDPKRAATLLFEGPHVVIRQGRTRATVVTLPVEDYPDLPVPRADAPRFALSGADLFTLAARARAVAGRDDTKPAMTGAWCELDADALTVVACDNQRLAVSRVPVAVENPAEVRTLLPSRVLENLARHLRTQDSVTLSLDPDPQGLQLAVFEAGGTLITVRPLPHAYFAWNTLVPSEFTASYELDTAAARKATEIAATAALRSTPVRVTFTDSAATFRAGNLDEGQVAHEIDATAVTGSFDQVLGLNPAHLIEGLKSLGTATTRLDLATARKPFVLSSPEAPGYQYVIAPVSING
ncbi:DNA polymerase III subunit beta [Streptacidiphilus sp. EB103A]|uniref:DNA polymerase III subunit beta n=1 Tax=Streptacidiphilus sp. EB103A TaxID=3156275 RepID=UPI003513FB8E